MAVPKKKTSKSKRNMRRSHDAIKPVNVIIDKDSGEYRLPHRVCKVTGKYNNMEVILQKNTSENEEE